MPYADSPTPLADRYRAYLAHCNAHDFTRLDDYVAEDVQVNGEPSGLTDYVAGLVRVTAAFPDYRWDPQHLLVEGDWLSAHLIDTGTQRGEFLGVAATGRSVRIQEFALYRWRAGRIREVHVVADNLSLLHQLTGPR